MKPPFVMSASSYTPPTIQTSENGIDHQKSFVVKHGKMKQGLLARAAMYTSNASKDASPSSNFNGTIQTASRDPIVWGDASKRYNFRRNEINNNSSTCFVNNSTLQQTEDELERESHQNVITPINRTSPFTAPSTTSNNVETTAELKQNNLTGLLKIPESSIIDNNLQGAEEAEKKSPPFLHMSTEAKRLSFDTTQQLRSGFFRSIKRQYSPLLPAKSKTAMQAQGSSNTPSPCGSASFSSNSNTDNSNDSDVDLESESRDTVSNTMSQLARQKLEQLRHQGPGKVDVATGLQWIRLELHEMREQDKSLFLQLIKLHSTIKDLRSDFNVAEEFDSYDDLHSAASLWWPRRGYSYSATTLPDFSSSDGAQLIRNGRPKQPLRRGFSLNYPPAVGPPSQPRLNFEFSRPPLTHSTSTESEVSLSLSDWKSATAC